MNIESRSQDYTMPDISINEFAKAISDTPFDNDFLESWERWQHTDSFLQHQNGHIVPGLRQLQTSKKVYGSEVPYEIEVYKLAYRVGFLILKDCFEQNGRKIPEPIQTLSRTTTGEELIDDTHDTEKGVTYVRAVRTWFDIYEPSIRGKSYLELKNNVKPDIETALFMGAAELYIDIERSLQSQ